MHVRYSTQVPCERKANEVEVGTRVMACDSQRPMFPVSLPTLLSKLSIENYQIEILLCYTFKTLFLVKVL